MAKIQGLILFDGPSKLDQQPIVVIATGFERPSRNVKTGPMIQVWIMRSDVEPIAAAYSGMDSSVCGNCPHRRTNKDTCYVNVAKAPYQIYKAYKAGAYTHYNKRHLKLFKDTKVRFGAYGEPVLLPIAIVRDIIGMAKSHTGYTHLWNTRHGKPYNGLFMASVDNTREAELAASLGWHYFRVMPIGSEAASNERLCLNEAKGIQCINCMLCNGAKSSIAITAHGQGAKRIE